MPARLAMIAFILGLLIPSIASAEDKTVQPYQSHAAFKTAILDMSTSPYVVLITVADDQTGRSSTGCTLAPFVVGAIYREKWGDSQGDTMVETDARYQEARKIALENTSHIFHFSKQVALDNLPFRYEDACRAIEQGKTARIGDRGPRLILGPFVEGPSINLRSCPPPEYPSDEKINDEGGTGISLLIGPDGSVLESKITESSGSKRRDEAIRAALSACKMKPKTIDGEPVPEPATLTIRLENRAHWARPR
jgi:TonB family protein